MVLSDMRGLKILSFSAVLIRKNLKNLDFIRRLKNSATVVFEFISISSGVVLE